MSSEAHCVLLKDNLELSAERQKAFTAHTNPIKSADPTPVDELPSGPSPPLTRPLSPANQAPLPR